MITAQDETYRDAKNIHSKYMRHQAFESEISANKERLDKLEDVSALLHYNDLLLQEMSQEELVTLWQNILAFPPRVPSSFYGYMLEA